METQRQAADNPGKNQAKSSATKRVKPRVALVAELERLLAVYTGAAVAAGVSLAALAVPAEAKIVYTPANVSTPLSLDLNNDGFADFVISTIGFGQTAGGIMTIKCAGHAPEPAPPKGGFVCNYQTNQIWGRGMLSGRFASALPAGVPVGPNKSYFQASAMYPRSGVLMAEAASRHVSQEYGTNTAGQWVNTESRYLGLQFVINGEVHYGWARLSVSVGDNLRPTGTLTGYAYETVPGKPIITGKTKGPDVVTLDPATLGHLAQGASQIQAWRGPDR